MEELLKLIFPPKCGICEKIGDYLCTNCSEKLKKYEINNEDLRKINKNMCFAFKYENLIRELLINYKFNDKSYLYKFFAKAILNNKKVYKFIKSYDIIIPVPLHKKRKIERGYNQSELVAREIAKIISKSNNSELDENKIAKIIRNSNNSELVAKGVSTKISKLNNRGIQSNPKIMTNILKKYKNTQPQSSKNYKQRIENAKGVYYVEKAEKIIEKNVLVFDDIYTTGATCKECKKVLLQAGAKRVGIFAIARDFLKWAIKNNWIKFN